LSRFPLCPELEVKAMANLKKGQLVRPPEWWKHLRWAKRLFWKRNRRAEHKVTLDELLLDFDPAKHRRTLELDDKPIGTELT
jgi:hypothetical protein